MTNWTYIARKFFLLATLLLISYCYAHAQTVTIPDPAWPLDSVINGAVHRYTVPGDRNYSEPSTFVWNVEGGRLFFDENLTQPAGTGETATVTGDEDNYSQLYVVWDSFDQPLDTGYVYAYEISSNNCELSEDLPEKYSGMRIKVSAPPDVFFFNRESFACTYNAEGVFVDVVIDGMPPFDLTFRIDGVEFQRHILPEDLFDSTFDGEENNMTIDIVDFLGVEVDRVYELELIEASSGGVKGQIHQPYHTVFVYKTPPAPVFLVDRTQVTVGQEHRYRLLDQGENPQEWFFELVDSDGRTVYDFNSRDIWYTDISFNYPAGDYILLGYYLSENGCISEADTLNISLYEYPRIFFSESTGHIAACSEATVSPEQIFEFDVVYEGALSYGFIYEIFDYNNVSLGIYSHEYMVNRTVRIQIPNTFINDEDPEIDRIWRVVIIEADNEEGLDVQIDDGERMMRIHPKPFIDGGIDFYN